MRVYCNSPEGRQFRESIKSLPTRETCDCSQGSDTAGIDGSSIIIYSLGPADGASLTVMVQLLSSPSKKGQDDEAPCDTVLHEGPIPLEGQGQPSQRNPTWEPAPQKVSSRRL